MVDTWNEMYRNRKCAEDPILIAQLFRTLRQQRTGMELSSIIISTALVIRLII